MVTFFSTETLWHLLCVDEVLAQHGTPTPSFGRQFNDVKATAFCPFHQHFRWFHQSRSSRAAMHCKIVYIIDKDIVWALPLGLQFLERYQADMVSPRPLDLQFRRRNEILQEWVIRLTHLLLRTVFHVASLSCENSKCAEIVKSKDDDTRYYLPKKRMWRG